MPKLLARLGLYSARHRFVVIAAWSLLAVFLGVVTFTSANTDAENTAGSTQATEALERVDELFPAPAPAGEERTLRLVVEAEGSASVEDPQVLQEVRTVLADAAALDHVAIVSDPFDQAAPFVSPDGSTVVATLTFDGLTEENEEAAYESIVAFAENAPDGLHMEVGGSLYPEELEIFGIGEVVGILVAFLVLFLTFGSLLVAGMNLLLAVLGVGVGIVGVLAYSAISPIQPTTITLATMLGLAVGIDYSLFILSRFRSELREGRSVDDAVGRATGTAGTAVVFAGLTVIIALAGLSITGISSIRDMGFAGAFAVLVAVLMSLTVLPIVLRGLGDRALPRRERHRRVTSREAEVLEAAAKPSFLRRWVEFVVKRPIVSSVGAVLLILVVASPMTSMATTSNVPGGTDPDATERRAYDLIVDEFGGIQSPLIILAEGDDIENDLDAVTGGLSALDDVESVTLSAVAPGGAAALLSVVPSEGPADESTRQLVNDIRNYAESFPGADLRVTGETAIGVDSDAALNSALVKYLIVIIVLSFVLLVLMFRSVLVPLFATLGYLLSVGASFGASTAVFQWGWLDPIIAAPQGDPMISILPIILVGILFGLAMDYQVFLVSRIKEMHSKGMVPKEAIISGFTRSGPVLVAAATIMTVVFAGFASSPMAVAASIAFGLVVGVMADAFLVRMVIMPALLTLVGEKAWWIPKWLDRILPDLDTEGHSLDHESTLPAARELHTAGTR